MKNQISAKVVADTISPVTGKRITSLQLVMPRFILAQFNTHRQFSRSTASSRAIPTRKLIEMVKNNPVEPVHWGKNQKGMQAREELSADEILKARAMWHLAKDCAVFYANYLEDVGAHKQIANRILEPFMWAHTIVTATEWGNFFALRCHDDAQPEMQMLANAMRDAIETSIPVKSYFHLPYIQESEAKQGELNLKEAWAAFENWGQISAARCARVSYLNHDQEEPNMIDDIETANYLRENKHLSPFEHQAFADEKLMYFAAGASNLQEWVSWRFYMERANCKNSWGHEALIADKGVELKVPDADIERAVREAFKHKKCEIQPIETRQSETFKRMGTNKEIEWSKKVRKEWDLVQKENKSLNRQGLVACFPTGHCRELAQKFNNPNYMSKEFECQIADVLKNVLIHGRMEIHVSDMLDETMRVMRKLGFAFRNDFSNGFIIDFAETEVENVVFYDEKTDVYWVYNGGLKWLNGFELYNFEQLFMQELMAMEHTLHDLENWEVADNQCVEIEIVSSHKLICEFLKERGFEFQYDCHRRELKVYRKGDSLYFGWANCETEDYVFAGLHIDNEITLAVEDDESCIEAGLSKEQLAKIMIAGAAVFSKEEFDAIWQRNLFLHQNNGKLFANSNVVDKDKSDVRNARDNFNH